MQAGLVLNKSEKPTKSGENTWLLTRVLEEWKQKQKALRIKYQIMELFLVIEWTSNLLFEYWLRAIPTGTVHLYLA